MMFGWMALAAGAGELWIDDGGLHAPWIAGVRGDGVCKLAAYVESDVPLTRGFYVDFFEGRSSAPDLGELGDWWFYVDPAAMRVWYMDGRELPRGAPPGDHRFYLQGVGEVRIYDDQRYNVYPTVTESTSNVWWDVLVNGGFNITENEYDDNHAEAYASCL